MNDLRDVMVELADEAVPVDLRDRVLRRSRVIGLRRTAGTALAAVVVVAGIAGAATAVGGGGRSAPTAASPSGSITPAGPDPRTIDWRDSTIEVPRFAGFESHCPAGKRRFVGGRSPIQGTVEDYFWIDPAPPVYADLDGHPGDEALLTVGCNGEPGIDPYLLLALKPMPDGSVRTLGPVVTDPTGVLDYDRDDVRVDGRVVIVETMGRHRANRGPGLKQQRGYAYEGRGFRQVSGPTTVAAEPSDVRRIDFRNTTLTFNEFTKCTAVCPAPVVRFVDGTGSDTVRVGQASFTRYTFTIQQISFVAGATGTQLATVTVGWRAPDGTPAQAVFAFAVPKDPTVAPVGWRVLGTASDGVSEIVDQHGSGNVLMVTVRTATGQEQRGYRQVNVVRWARVS
ncbi:MAG TPA: hypothetical protein VF054_18520 [Micromonosporaceae bacterium]